MQNKEIEEDNTFKISIPLITNAELNAIDNNLDDFINQLTKQVIHDKDLVVAQHIVKKQKEYIDQLETRVKELEKENTDIKEVYIRTTKHLDKKGMLELSEYLLAQIEATPTFTTWEEYTTWVSKQVIRDKIAELNKEIEKYREYTERGIETDVEWVDNVADRQTVKALQELLEEK